MNRSFFSRFAFPLLSWGLPFHILGVALLFGVVGLPVNLTRTIAAWKEAFVAVILAFVLLRAITGRGPGVRIHWLDITVAGLVCLATAYGLTANLWIYPNLTAGAQLLGWRDAVFFVLLYFVGRASPEVGRDPKMLRRLVIVVAVTSLVAVIERIFVTPEMLVLMGVASYFQDFLGVSAFTVGNDYGLPLNYWTILNGHAFQRAGSIYLSSQSFAVPFLLLLPVATVWIFGRDRKPSWFQIGVYGIVWLGLLLTLTRMTTLVCIVQLVLYVVITRRQIWAVSGLGFAVLVLLGAIALIPGFPVFLWHTVSWQEGSSVSHLKDWGQGLSAFLDAPWGSGLGTTDQTAVRNGLQPLTADNLFFKYAVELGALGLGLLLAILAGVAALGRRLHHNGSSEPERNLGLVMLLTTIGITLNGATGAVFNAVTLSWLWFWLAGTIVSLQPNALAPRRVTLPITERSVA